MADITEIIEESAVQLEIVESGGGQIEIVEGDLNTIEVIETTLSSNDLDLTLQINTLLIESPNTNTTVDVSVQTPTTVEATITNNIIEITENQVLNVATQSINQTITQIITPSQFTDENALSLLNLIFIKGTISLSVNSSSDLEKNLATNITFTHNVTLNEDVISAATFDDLDVTSNPNNSQIYNTLNTITKTFNVTFAATSIGTPARTVLSTKTATFKEPQYCGVSDTTNFDESTYSNLNLKLTKKIQSGDNISQIVSPTNQYVYFLSTNSNATITDGNGFDNTSDFNKTSITVKYANNNNQTLHQYRTIGTKTLTNFTYNIT